MSNAVMGANGSHTDIIAQDYAASDGLMTRTATNSTSTRSASGGFIETLGGSDNDTIHRYLGVPVDLSKVGTNGFIDCRLAITEAATDNMEAFVGISDGFPTATTGIFSNTAGALTTGDHFGWRKVAESLFHRTEAISSSTAEAGALSSVALVSATEYSIRVEWNVTTLGIDLNVLVDGVALTAISNFSLTGVSPGFVGVAMKATNSNAEVLRVEKFVVGNVQGV